MPTVLQLDGFRVLIYSNDHRPPHVHVIGTDREAVMQLHCRTGLISLRENYGFLRREVTSIQKHLTKNVEHLCRAWKEIHGDGGYI